MMIPQNLQGHSRSILKCGKELHRILGRVNRPSVNPFYNIPVFQSDLGYDASRNDVEKLKPLGFPILQVRNDANLAQKGCHVSKGDPYGLFGENHMVPARMAGRGFRCGDVPGGRGFGLLFEKEEGGFFSFDEGGNPIRLDLEDPEVSGRFSFPNHQDVPRFSVSEHPLECSVGVSDDSL